MSWQKCENAETLPLAVPAAVILVLDLLHLWVCLSLFLLQVPPDLTVLLLVLVARSWTKMYRRLDRTAQLELRIDPKGLFYVNEYPRRWASENSGHERVVEDHAVPLFIATQVNDAPETVVTQRQGTEDAEALQQYTCCRSVRVPGCILLTLVDGSAKPLEILVFYRYYQRQFYRRLLRQLAFQ